MTNVATLPDDVEALKALVVKQRERIAALEHNLELLIRWQQDTGSYGQSSGPLPENGQGHLFALDLVVEAESTSAAAETRASIELTPAKPRKSGGRRSKFPDHLPRAKTRYELDPEKRVCPCGGELHEIGVETSREIDRIEISVVHTIERVKYACRTCEEGVVTTPGPARVFDKGILAPGFLASVLVERFGNHMPYHRLEKKYAAEGLKLSRSVLERSAAKCAELLEPIWREVRREVLAAPAIHTDDTGVTVARSSMGGSHTGHVWIYLNQDGDHFYDFTESHCRDGPRAVLGEYEGYIHADACPLYDSFFESGAREVACWAHTRRRFEEAEHEYPDLAEKAIEQIRDLYRVDREAKDRGLDAEGRRALRLEHSVPVLDALQSWLELAATEVLPKSKMADAIGYARRQGKALRTFLEDGRLELDNNAAERALRAVAVGRKNWLFYLTPGGGRNAVIVLSLLMSAKAHGLNPAHYLRDVLLRIATETDVRKLTPAGWKKHFAAEVQAQRERATALLLSSC
jgi:transposase